MIQGIYIIKNKLNDKVYIGQSKNIKRRWKEHRSTAFNPNSTAYNTHLHKSFRKNGLENFSFEVLEEVKDFDELNSKENYYINKYNSIDNGYNNIYTSRNGLSADDLNRKREEKYGVNKEELVANLYEHTFEHVAEIYGVSSNAIRKWCKDYGIPHSAKDYMTEEKERTYIEKMKIIGPKNVEHLRKEVAMIDKETLEVVKTYPCTSVAANELGVTTAYIKRAIFGTEGRKTAKGYRWSYVS